MRRWWLSGPVAAAFVLAGCGGVRIAPEPVLPKALVQPIPAKVGFVIAGDQRNYAHNEERLGVPWSVSLGKGQEKLAREVFGSLFSEAREFPDLDAARAAPGLQAIFDPRIEQYSFATARETGGDYVAVTIRYRINLLAPDGRKYDAFTLTGYGNSMASSMSNATPLEQATRAAMRDAAAKLLTQFPEVPVAAQLGRGEVLVATADGAGVGPTPALQAIEAVPVRPSRRGPGSTWIPPRAPTDPDRPGSATGAPPAGA
jgi:hypothetical protein